MTPVELVLRVGVAALCLYAAYEDMRLLRIRNVLVLIVAALFLPMLFLLSWGEIAAQLIAAAILLVVGAALFFARLFGGGDAKLIAAVALWIVPASLPAFLLIMSLAGGVIALTALGLRRTEMLPKLAAKAGENSWFAALARGETVVPYGIAIAIATVLTLF